jgi:phosphotransferase system HPr-like phosphotransfer protein
MIQLKISLPALAQAQQFIAAVTPFACEIDLIKGRYCVNGKSLLGILCLLEQDGEIMLEAAPATEEEAAFRAAVKPFEI